MLSIASYPLFFTWAPLLIAPAALLLGRAGLARAKEGQGGSRFAAAGVLAGLATLVFAAFLLTYALLHDGSYPWIFGG